MTHTITITTDGHTNMNATHEWLLGLDPTECIVCSTRVDIATPGCHTLRVATEAELEDDDTIDIVLGDVEQILEFLESGSQWWVEDVA